MMAQGLLKKKYARHILEGAIFGAGAVALTLMLFQFSFFRVLELKAYDAMMRLRGTRSHSAPIVIVAIDEQTLRTYEYPVLRGKLGSVFAIATQHGAAVIGVDELLTNRRTDAGALREDSLLLGFSRLLPNVFHAIGPFIPNDGIVGSTKYVDFDPAAYQSLHRHAIKKSTVEVPFPRALNIDERPFDSLAAVTEGVGHILVRPDSLDGVVRSMPFFIEYAGEYYPALGARLALTYLKLDMHAGVITRTLEGFEVAFNRIVIPLSANGDLLIDYAGRNGIFRTISFSEVIDAYLRGDSLRLDVFKNAIVIIGATARSVGDHNSTPIADLSPNCYIHANVAEQIVSGVYIRPVPSVIYGFILLTLCIALGIFTQVLQPRWSLVWTMTFIIGYLDTAYAIFIKSGYVLPVFAPLIALAVCYVIAISYSSSVERKRKSQMKEMFQKYVDVSIVEQLIENPLLLKLGGEVSEITTMFADVQGFTRLAEQLDPQKTVGILNTYFTDISHFILEDKGTVDKYIGDAVMAFWGAPLEDHDHAFHACSAALAMQRFINTEYRDEKRFSGPIIRQRVGLNTGTAVVGNMGSEAKFSYTAIGDSVNIASRLSGVNKEYGTNLLMTENTYTRVQSRVLAREIDNVLVLGKTKAVKMFELLSMVNDTHPDEFWLLLDSFQKGLDAYKRREWQTGIHHFEDVLNRRRDDMVAHLYIQRSLFFMEEPPPDDWDGVFVMTRK